MEPQCGHPCPLDNHNVTGSNQQLLFYHYQKEEDEDKEKEVKEAQCAHPPPLDNDDVIGSNQCLSAEGRVEHQKLNQTEAMLSFG